METTPPLFLYTRHPGMHREWPYVDARMATRLKELGAYEERTIPWERPLEDEIDLRHVVGLARFGGSLTSRTLAFAPNLRMLGVNTDNSGQGLPLAELWDRGITVIDTTRAWAASVAEVGLALALNALRGIPRWHMRMALREPLFTFAYAQFCDDPHVVNGELGTKCVGIIGLGQIGSRVARVCGALGSSVIAYDPFVPRHVAESSAITIVEIDALVRDAEVVFVTVPPTPSARHLLNRERIGMLRQGAIVVIVTRAHAVDMTALRERIVADELVGAFDVYDVEPLPVDDVLRNRPNVVHTPHIAGRTRDANLRAVDLIADDFARLLRQEPARHALSPRAAAVRTGAL